MRQGTGAGPLFGDEFGPARRSFIGIFSAEANVCFAPDQPLGQATQSEHYCLGPKRPLAPNSRKSLTQDAGGNT